MLFQTFLLFLLYFFKLLLFFWPICITKKFNKINPKTTKQPVGHYKKFSGTKNRNFAPPQKLIQAQLEVAAIKRLIAVR